MNQSERHFRIGIGSLLHETNTYIREKTTMEDFFFLAGSELMEANLGCRTFLGGMIQAGLESGIEIIPTLQASVDIVCSGTIEANTYQTIKARLLDSIKAALPLDAVCLALHGAGVAEGVFDLEKDVIDSVRELVGSDVPIAAAMDLHGNMDPDTLANANLAFCLNHAPHVDKFERGFEAIKGLEKMLNKTWNPVMHLEKLPMLMAPTTTNSGPAHALLEFCQEMEKREGIIDCACFHGFPYSDVPSLGVSVLVIADGDKALAEQTAKDVASYIWENRDSFLPNLISPKEAIRYAKDMYAKKGGPIVIADGADNPGGGGSCNATHLLRAMLEENLPKACFALIKDPAAVEAAYKAGPGSTISLYIGGNQDDLNGDPVQVTATVKCITDGKFTIIATQNQGVQWDLERTALLRIGGLDLIVANRRYQPFDPEIFRIHGINYLDYPIVAVKSTNHWRAGFPDVKDSVITDTPAYMSLNVGNFKHTNFHKDVWPLNPDAIYSPAGEIN